METGRKGRDVVLPKSIPSTATNKQEDYHKSVSSAWGVKGVCVPHQVPQPLGPKSSSSPWGVKRFCAPHHVPQSLGPKSRPSARGVKGVCAPYKVPQPLGHTTEKWDPQMPGFENQRGSHPGDPKDCREIILLKGLCAHSLSQQTREKAVVVST